MNVKDNVLNWDDIVSDTIEKKVFLALEDKSYQFRTIDGISRETGLDTKDIRNIIDKYSDLIRMSPAPDSEGKALFTLANNPVNIKEKFIAIRSFVTKNFR